ncbi:unnamed protein product [Symbiodinium necroappetens]|uniref:Ferric oxidoreductase domain-containing protein n=1 Tax=Symbiodinium necroappetens TaxID=1628268 RepID=A0A812Q0M9_9DINO|nr:unnamed protein product [Symbiodinium necroappetens]
MPGSKAYPSLAGSWKFMMLAAGLYEPLRYACWRLGENVGGVGGIGGLCNLQNPDECSTFSGHAGSYCFKPGVWAGLTGFAIVVLLVWISPLLLGALRMSVSSSKGETPIEEEGRDGDNHRVASAEVGLLVTIWSGLSVLWFAMPLTYMLADTFYQSSFSGVLLAVALAAAFPLSWHLSLLAVPVSQAVGPFIGLGRQGTIDLHKALGWRTAGWAAIHACGELIYVFRTSGLQMLFQLSGENGDHLFYLLGLIAALMLLVHTVVAFYRKHPRISKYFKASHRTTASLVLLAATAHWAPFALFLLPSAAAYGAAAATVICSRFGRKASTPRACLALVAAILGAVAGLLVVWKTRETVMMSRDVGLLLPFIFPPLALLAEVAAAMLVCLPVLLTAPAMSAGAEGHSMQLMG